MPDKLTPLRLFRLSINPPENPAAADAAAFRTMFRPTAEATGASLTLPNCLSIEINEPRRVVAIISECIYCRAKEYELGTDKSLSEEHFVAEGLGSRLVLGEASCKTCAERTEAIETAVLQKSLLAARRKLNIRGKKRKRGEQKFAIRRINVDGSEVIEWRALEDHPTILLIPQIDAPGLLSGRPLGDSPVMSVWSVYLGGFSTDDMRSFSSPVLDTVAFCQMLAKMAHGFAVWQFGLDGFRPLLTDFILNGHTGDEHSDRYHLIGGDLADFAPSNVLHVLGWSVHRQGETDYLLISIRLFSYLGGPIFYAVAGELDAPQVERARAVAEEFARASHARRSNT
ncbi:MAG: hypothetical protein AAB403_02455 [Planctomycetota bacterium]